MMVQIILGVVSIVSLLLGFMVWRGSTQNQIIRSSFMAVSLCLALWSVGLSMFLSTKDPGMLDLSSRIFYVSAALFSPLLIIFATYFQRSNVSRLSIGWVRIMGLSALAFSVYIVLAPEFIIDSSTYESGREIVLSDMQINSFNYMLFSFFFVLFFAITVVIGFYRWRSAAGREQRQIGLFLVGLLVASIPGFVVDLVLPASGEYSHIWIGPLFVLVFIGAIAYAIVRYGMFDIRLAAARGVAYTLILSTLAVIYFVLAYLLSVLLFGGGVSTDVSLSPVNVIIALVLALVFQPVKQFFDQLTNKIFFRGEYSRETFFREFGRILSYDTDLRLLLRQASGFIADNLKSEWAAFYIVDRGVYGQYSKRGWKLPVDDIEAITRHYRQSYDVPSAIVTDLVKSEDVRRILLSHQIYLALPMMIQGQPIGFLFLGEHKSRGYTNRDIGVLESIVNELTIAVQNSLSVEEIRDLNENLQRRVDDATKELRTSNRQLQRLDEAKNEFISMASHQLRTPLTSIKGYLDMVLQGDLGRVSATQRAVLSEAFISSERMVSLINDFLNISRLQTGKFVIERRESDLSDVVKEQLQMLRVLAKQHDLTLKESIGKDVPLLNIDIEKLRQVTLNFIDNAIYYSKPGTKVKVDLVKDRDSVVFTVKDTGIGVPESEKSGLFSKFFRGSNARKRRPDGTGVGLFLAKKVILAHGGEVIFESTENKGSTFGFRIPIKQPKSLK